jgi:pyruvate formate lyase activating enzyme
MKIGGFLKVTLLDYPELVAATVFTIGCNMRCPFCHNPELISKNNHELILENDILDYLSKRKNLLGGVCITGGEPLLQTNLDSFIKKIKDIGLKVKLDTNGTMPELLKKLNPDYIAMDIKTSLKKYEILGFTGKENIQSLIKESVSQIINSGIDHEFRTTVIPELVNIEDIKEIIELIKGAQIYYLDQFRPKNLLDKDWEKIIPYSKDFFEKMQILVNKSGIDCKIRI